MYLKDIDVSRGKHDPGFIDRNQPSAVDQQLT